MKKENSILNLDKKLTPIAQKLARNKYLSSVSQGFVLILPLIMVGSLFSIFTGLSFGGYQDFITSSGIKNIISQISNFTIEILSIYVTFAIAYCFAKNEGKEKYAVVCGLISIMTFLILTPVATPETGKVLPFQWIGSNGMIVAILCSFTSTKLYLYMVTHGWTIKMPSSVPQNVSESFSALIPGLAIALFYGIIALLFTFTPYVNIHASIQGLLQIPLQGLTTSVWALVFLVFVTQFLWMLGIQSFGIVFPCLITLFLPNTLENLSAYAAGEPVTHLLTFGLWRYALLGGSGLTIGLIAYMAFFAKSERYKKLGKIALIPGIFNINEPVIFGIPIVLNPIMALPFIAIPCLSILITYYAMSFGLIPYILGIDIPFTIPMFINGFIQGGFKIVLWEVFIFFFSFFAYMPFFKIVDKQAVIEETAAKLEGKA